MSVLVRAQSYPVKVAGERHTLVLFSDGTVGGWGPCDSGQLGPIAAIPQKRNWATKFVYIKLPGKAVDIAAGESASFALLDDGTVVAWGSNYNFLLGNPAIEAKSENPVKIPNLTGVAQISAWGQSALALRRDGTVAAWGYNYKGRDGDGKTPSLVTGVRGIKQISASGTHAMALDEGGHVWTWGGSLSGALGRTTDLQSAGQVPGLDGVVAIAAGGGVSTVIKKDGTVWVWGSNSNGQFGNGRQSEAPVTGSPTNEIQSIPQQVPGVRSAVSVTSGSFGRHTIVLLKDGTLRGWGNSDWGQLGAGVTGDFQLSPVTPKITGVKAVFAVANNLYAIKNDNTVWIWGVGYRGEYPLSANVSIPKQLLLAGAGN